jgi:hypothetical protein
LFRGVLLKVFSKISILRWSKRYWNLPFCLKQPEKKNKKEAVVKTPYIRLNGRQMS